jgi:hypothetical protein
MKPLAPASSSIAPDVVVLSFSFGRTPRYQYGAVPMRYSPAIALGLGVVALIALVFPLVQVCVRNVT